MKDSIGCFGWFLVIVTLVIISPLLYYFCGWLTGIILQMFIGNTVVDGLNYVFNTTRFTVDMLPTICGTLAVIGSFFKNSYARSENNN